MASDSNILSEIPSEKSSSKGLFVGMLVATVFAVGAGAAIGFQFSSLVGASIPEKTSEKEKHEPIEKKYSGKRVVKALPHVVTNLAAPKNTWVRMEASIIVGGEELELDVLAAKISADTLAYLRTLALSDIEGASGLAYLRGDLNERARARSDGKVLELVIGSLIVE